jgi:hypothetical protein
MPLALSVARHTRAHAKRGSDFAVVRTRSGTIADSLHDACRRDEIKQYGDSYYITTWISVLTVHRHLASTMGCIPREQVAPRSRQR